MFEERHYALFQPLVEYIDLPTLASLCCSCKTLNGMFNDEQIFVHVLIGRHLKDCFTRLTDNEENEGLFLHLMDTLGIDGMIENQKIIFDQQREIDDSALHAAIDINFQEAFDKLIEIPGIELSEIYNRGEPPLHRAVKLNDKYMVKRLLEKGADPNIQTDCDFVSAMHFAAQYADVEMMKILEPYTQDGYHNADSDHGVTPLFSACAGDNVETARFLVEECDLDPNEVEKYCGTPVMYALYNNANDVLAYLVREAPGFDPNIGSNDCFPCKPITIANTKQKRLLLEHPNLDLKLPYNGIGKRGSLTPLEIALFKNDYQAVDMYVRRLLEDEESELWQYREDKEGLRAYLQRVKDNLKGDFLNRPMRKRT